MSVGRALLLGLALLTNPALAADADEPPLIAIVSQQAARLSLVDPASATIIGQVALDKVPAGVAVTRDGRTAYVTHPDLGRISAVDLTALRVDHSFKLGREPFGIVIDPISGDLIVTDWSADALIRIDAATGTEVARVAVGRSPAGLVVDQRGERVYVADRESNTVSVIDIRSMQRVASFPVGRAPFALALSPDQSRLYVANVRSNDLSVLALPSGRELSRPHVGLMPYGVAVTAGGVAVTNQQGGKLAWLDAGTLEVTNETKIGDYPEGIITLTSRQVALALWADDALCIASRDVRTGCDAMIRVPAGPRLLAAVPRTVSAK